MPAGSAWERVLRDVRINITGEPTMARAFSSLAAAAAAAAGVYFLDKKRGRQRRARVTDGYTHLRSRLVRGIEPVRRDFANRLSGLSARWQKKRERAAAPDLTVAQRVRSALGRCVSHPRAVSVTVRAGRVELAGDILSAEHQTLLDTVGRVDGVMGLDDALAVHQSSDGIPALQGGRPRTGQRSELLRDRWRPATRALMGVAGAGLAAYGLARGRLLTVAIGSLVAARSAVNRPFAAMLGMQQRGAVHVQKTIAVRAPVDAVYETLRNYDMFPRFMRNVRSVEVRPDGVSHWTVAGPAGVPVEWDAITTDLQENQLIAWSSLDGSVVTHNGAIRLTPEGNDSTRIHIMLDYTPPAGAVGHVVAKLFGADPKSELDEDMLRLKALLEGVAVPQDAAAMS